MKQVRKQEFCDESGLLFFEGRHCGLNGIAYAIFDALGLDVPPKDIIGYYIRATSFRNYYSLAFVFEECNGFPIKRNFVCGGNLTFLRRLVFMLCTSAEDLSRRIDK